MKRNSLYLFTALSLALHLLLFLVLPEGQVSDVNQPAPLRVGFVRPTDEAVVASSEKSVSSESSSSEDSDSIKKGASPPRTNTEISPEPDKQDPLPSPSHIPDDSPATVNQNPPEPVEPVEPVEIKPEPPSRRQVISKQLLAHPEGTGSSESDSSGKMESEPSLVSRASSSGAERVRAAPDYAVNPPPRYPYSARKRGWEGTVMVRVLVSTSGRPIEASVENSSGYTLLDRSALKAVQQWKFHPGKRGDIAVKSEVLVPVIFRMES